MAIFGKGVWPLSVGLNTSVGKVENNRERNRFEIKLDGNYAFLTYQIADGQIDLLHTEVPKEWRGQAIGQKLVLSALQFARVSGLTVVPSCPFVAALMKKPTRRTPT